MISCLKERERKKKRREKKRKEREKNAKAPKGWCGKEGADDGIPFCLRLHLEWEEGARGGGRVEERRKRRVGGPPARRSSFKLASRSF